MKLTLFSSCRRFMNFFFLRSTNKTLSLFVVCVALMMRNDGNQNDFHGRTNDLYLNDSVISSLIVREWYSKMFVSQNCFVRNCRKLDSKMWHILEFVAQQKVIEWWNRMVLARVVAWLDLGWRTWHCFTQLSTTQKGHFERNYLNLSRSCSQNRFSLMKQPIWRNGNAYDS